MELKDEVVDEEVVLDGKVFLVKTTLWSPQSTEFQFKIINADCDLNTIEEWHFDNEEAAFEAMEDLRANLRG